MEVNMTKLIFTVENGRTICNDCPFASGDSFGSFVCGKDENSNLYNLDCKKYDLSTLLLINEEE